MYVKHPVCITPEDENIKIWRYMDFTKFVSLLEKRSLFFSKAKLLEDPLEGMYPKPDKQEIALKAKESLTSQFPNQDLSDDVFNKLLDTTLKTLREFTAINSWHINYYESAAMWKLYLQSNEGIAVQSTFKKLTECFRNTELAIYVGKVNYLDYETDSLPPSRFEEHKQGGKFLTFLCKRKSFEYESELRAIVEIPLENQKSNLSDEISSYKGIYVPVDLDNLIETIFVSPTAPRWFKELVESVLHKYDLTKTIVEQSNLYSDSVI